MSDDEKKQKKVKKEKKHKKEDDEDGLLGFLGNLLEDEPEDEEKKDKHHKKDKKDKKEKGGYDAGTKASAHADCEKGFDVDWMFNDTAWGALSQLNPLRWSGPVYYKEAIRQIKEQYKDDDRPILMKIPADSETAEAYASCKEAIAFLMKCSKVQKKARKAGMEADDLVRIKAREKDFEKKFGFKRPDIKHIVCLMLENRTFDGVQGAYMNERYESGEVSRSIWDNDGQDLYSYTNPVNDPDGNPVDFSVWSLPADDPNLMSRENMSAPSGPAGPVEKFHFLNMCSYGVLRPEQEHIEAGPEMKGFAQQYYTKELANMPEDGSSLLPGIAGTDFENARSPAMHVFRKEQMPVLTALMESFGCSDTHFSSAPCQTWPNRLFASCGTCFGYYNNLPYVNEKAEADGGNDETHYFQSEAVDKLGAAAKMFGSYDTDTVFHRLQDRGVSWGIYHGQASLAVITTKLKYDMCSDNVSTLADFKVDCELGDLPEFVWLEPNYDPADPEANDMHPPANVLHGQKLIADVYNTLRANENIWNHCLFIVTCDEGVGSFDHVKPPAAVDPEVGHDHEYVCQIDGSPYEMSTNPFTRFGTRVPNLLISPFIEPRTVVRPKGHDDGDCPYPFDHTSIIRTAFDLFLCDPEEALTKRDAAAPSFVHCLGEEASNPGPLAIVCPPFDSDPKKRSNSHTCHSAGEVSELMKGGFQGTALASTFTTDLAAMFGI